MFRIPRLTSDEGEPSQKRVTSYEMFTIYLREVTISLRVESEIFAMLEPLLAIERVLGDHVGSVILLYIMFNVCVP